MRHNIYVQRIYVFVLEHTGGHNQQEKDDDWLELTWGLHYLVSTGIYAGFRKLQKNVFFSPNDYASLLWEQGAWYPVYLYTRKPACNALLLHRLLGGICLFTTSYLYWWWSFSLNLESDVAVELNQAETVTYGPSWKWCSMKEEYRNISNLINSLFNWSNMLDIQKSLL